ncbi:SDR family NAD(P)-dependent oxidoreductase [Luteipulveratus mongoliensis]|uniref:Short-chain dehydrogenase n=1 Tax=Luteipulveratus mongoliensis TaxID=571913 RepID=A0A0K1JIB3_9MICO|nr:SDR family NAD(P)-dependent oxidoreductase [Luteipulveratus mongoliensis]AKU16459.1 short-chain dehydrogenase [Luteipulveratus mongoliensis]
MSSIALVTGANRGLGQATAVELARQGHLVVIGGRNPAAAACAAEAIRADGWSAESVELDVTSRETVLAAAKELQTRHGRVDVLINNAGVLPEIAAGGEHDLVDLDALEQTFAVNVIGAAVVLEAFLPLVTQSDAGRIINVSSRMGSMADQLDPESPYYGMVLPAYQASKAALNSLTIGLSKQLGGSTTRVVSVCPGFVQTDLTPISREQAPLTAAQAAQTVVAALDSPSGTFVDADGVVPW